MKPSHRVFVNEFLRTGDQVKAYQKAYPNVSDNAARSAANRLLQDAEIAYFINNVYDEVKEEVMAEFRERMVELYDLKVYLSQMIRREMLNEREVKTKDGTMILHSQPGFAQVLRAGHMLCVLEGWYKLSAEKESERAGGNTGAESRGSWQEEMSAEEEIRNLQILTPEERESLRAELLAVGKEHEALLKEHEDEGVLAELLYAVEDGTDLGYFSDMDLLDMKTELEALLAEQDQLQEEEQEQVDTVSLENEKNNIELLQHSATKNFAESSGPIVCDFTTKPQKMSRITRGNE